MRSNSETIVQLYIFLADIIKTFDLNIKWIGETTITLAIIITETFPMTVGSTTKGKNLDKVAVPTQVTREPAKKPKKFKQTRVIPMGQFLLVMVILISLHRTM